MTIERTMFSVLLKQGVISKLQTIFNTTFQREDLLTCNLDIWKPPPSTTLTPRPSQHRRST
ncbi:hypothetical protein V8C34DRAFT_291937 [Trichoderma compactum]